MKKIKLLVPVILISFSVLSQETPKDIVERFFDEYKEKGASVALDNLYESNKWMSRSGDAIIKLKSQMEGLTLDYVGENYGHELIIEKKLTDNFTLLSYMVRFGRQPIRFTFQFYRPKEKWQTHSFKFDGEISDEIEEAAKLYYLTLKN